MAAAQSGRSPRAPVASPEPSGYRPALDGVRAVAVLAVIAFHVTGVLPGGFLGVDVFFVLSGYLITGLLLRELRTTGRLRLPDFWARRARRLLPAVLLLIAVTSLVTGHWSSIGTFAARRADSIATLFYYANWHFIATDQSYFATYTGASPLRHMWSLAIEEQFYLVWPVLVLGLAFLGRGRPRALLALIAAGTAASAAEMVLRFDPASPSRAYYGTDTRAQTLLVGAGLAVLLSSRPDLLASERARSLAKALSVPVFAGLILAFATVQAAGSFYLQGGATAFAFAAATGLWIIEILPRAPAGSLLSLGPLRWIGRISYGLYLWHFPIVVWLGGTQRLTLGPRSRQVLEVVATFAIATASFYLLEWPVRSGRVPWLGRSNARLAVVLSVSAGLILAVTLWSTAVDRSSPLLAAVADPSDAPCPPGSPSVGSVSWCVRTASASGRAPVVAAVGDSTAMALDPGLRRVAAAAGWRYIQAGRDGCSLLPLLFPPNMDAAGLAQARRCVAGVTRALVAVKATEHPDVWFVSDRFALAPLVRADGVVLPAEDRRREAPILAALRAVLVRLTAGGSRVVIVAMPPAAAPPECAGRATPACRSVQYSVRDGPTVELDRLYRRAAESMPGSVTYVSVTDILCPDHGLCPATLGGALPRYDQVHYTATFSRRIVPVIVARARAAGVTFGGRLGARVRP